MQRRDRSRKPSIEGLENRELMSWGTANVPAQIAKPTGGVSFADAYTWAGDIATVNSPPQGATFIAPHTGLYTITTTGTPFTQQTMNGPIVTAMVPIFGVYNQNGTRIAESWSGNSTTQCVVNLTQGQRYEVVTTSLAGRYVGPFTINVTGNIGMAREYLSYNYGNFTVEAYINSNNQLVVDAWTFNSNWFSSRTDNFSVHLINAQKHSLLDWNGFSITTGPSGSKFYTDTLNLGPYTNQLGGLYAISLTN